jgi:hypothetical protein
LPPAGFFAHLELGTSVQQRRASLPDRILDSARRGRRCPATYTGWVLRVGSVCGCARFGRSTPPASSRIDPIEGTPVILWMAEHETPPDLPTAAEFWTINRKVGVS